MTLEECIDGLQEVVEFDKNKILVKVHVGFLIHAIKFMKEQEAQIEQLEHVLKESTDQKRGHWVKMTGMMPPEFTGHFECDNCGWHGKMGEHEKDFDFCPGCGSKMSIGFPGFDEYDCKSTPFDEILGDYLKKMNNENEKEK